MDLQKYVKTVADSEIGDWTPILRPTYRNRFIPRKNAKEEVIGLAADQHPLHLTFLRDIRITVAYGMVDNANYQIPSPNAFASENARTHLLDCFWEGRLAFRETLVNVGRGRGCGSSSRRRLRRRLFIAHFRRGVENHDFLTVSGSRIEGILDHLDRFILLLAMQRFRCFDGNVTIRVGRIDSPASALQRMNLEKGLNRHFLHVPKFKN